MSEATEVRFNGPVYETPEVLRFGDCRRRACASCGYHEVGYDPFPDASDPNPRWRMQMTPKSHLCPRTDGRTLVIWPLVQPDSPPDL